MVLLGILKIAFCLRDQYAFMWQSLEFWTFSILSFWNKFSERQKTLSANYRIFFFLFENTKTESATFLYKTALPETNVKKNSMESTKWTHYKEQSFASNYFFWKFCFSIRISDKQSIWCNNYQSICIHIFWKCWSFIWGCFFHVVFLKQMFFPLQQNVLI